jgi:sugar lactone lactonase YvrE
VRALRLFCLAAVLVTTWFVIPRAAAQTFLGEWTAASDGGVGPAGMTLSTEGAVTYLYVSDYPRGRVLKLNAATGAVAGVFGKQGNALGDLNGPFGIARDPTSGDFYIAERGSHRITRITTSGAFVMAFGTVGNAAGQLNEPVGVAVDAAGAVYVTEHANHRVQKFTVTQTAGVWNASSAATWGTQGTGSGQFNRPYGITADASGNIWVADGLNGRVQRFNTSGVYQSTLGSAGTAPGQFVVATSFAVAPNGELFVTSTNSNSQDGTLVDANNQWISRFNSTGAFLTRWGGNFGTAIGQFRQPTSVVVGANNRAYVADYYNSRIQVFDVSGPDTTAPTVAAFSVGTSTAASVNFVITFSEPVLGVDAADFTAVTAVGATASIGAVSGGGTVYTVPVAYTGTGTIRLDLKSSGTGIADAAGNATPVGATGPLFTTGSVSGTQITGITLPANGTYGKNQELFFVVRFSSNVTVSGGKPPPVSKGNDDDAEDESSAYFTWTAVPAAVQGTDSGKVHYVSGSGTNALTFRLRVHNGDLAPLGIRLGTLIQLEDGAVIRDAGGVALNSQQLTLLWAQNPLSGVILNAPKPGNGNGGTGNNGNGKGRNDRLVNLSSRLRVTGGDASRSVVVGFVVTGEASKQILIRAVGPGLAGFGVRDALEQPVLVLRDSTGKTVAENDGWKNSPDVTSAGDRVGAFKLGNGSRDAALLATLTPGAYTAQVTANGNGIVLVEVYDTVSGTQLSTEQIVNISTRGFVGTGDDVLVAGFVVTGGAPKRVLIRGIGPALAPFGVPGVLQDPVLQLYSAGNNNPIAQNDNWETPQPIGAPVPATAAQLVAASTAAGAFPLSTGGKDAAIIVSLNPGNYSAVVSGLNNGTGAGLVEVYELP